jgi:hypothetical protein
MCLAHSSLILLTAAGLALGCGNSGDGGDEGCQRDADCAAGQSCDFTQDPPACVEACSDDCPTTDATRCYKEAVVQRCSLGDDGCLDWIDQVDCALDGQTCHQPDGLDATCVEPCDNECDPVDRQRCNGTVIERCMEGADGCTDWAPELDCATTDKPICDDAFGEAECVAHECEADDTRCAGDVVQTCIEIQGQRVWADYMNCATDGQVCDASGAEATCTDP